MARTNNDHIHLRRLRDTYAQMGCFPSYAGMAKALGFRAKNAAYKLSQRLIASGHLTRNIDGRLAPGPSFFTLDISDDEVRAGFGSEGNATGLFHAQSLDQLLVSKPSRTILVKVRGESMTNAGILSGDVAVVETRHRALAGEIVVAEMDGCYTIKQLQSTPDGSPLLVAHDEQKVMLSPKQTFNIVGIVRGIIRSYPPSAAKSNMLRQKEI
ncbi:LexA family protein [Eoetvoesiella caeni]